MDFTQELQSEDKEIFNAIRQEATRQQEQIELIASENIVSRAVLEAQGSILTNKYAEGYPAHRYYGGCEYVDVVENLAIERAKKLFNELSTSKVRYHDVASYDDLLNVMKSIN